jgi:hypothetical protein
MQDDDIVEGVLDDPSPKKKGFKHWYQEWRAAFKFARNPLNYSKKDWAVNIVSSFFSYLNAGLVAFVGWLTIKLPWLLPGLKAVWAKITAAVAALFHVATGQ